MTIVVFGFDDVDNISDGLRLSGYGTRNGGTGFLSDEFFFRVRDTIAIDGDLYFAAENENHGLELWKTNATPAGTVLVKDIRSGGGIGSNLREFVEFKGKLLFVANDGAGGAELWRSDGTAAGTVLVKDIRAGSDSSDPFRLTAVDSDHPGAGNTLVYFNGTTSNTASNLFVSDGNGPGTLLFTDLTGAALPAGETAPLPIAVLHDRLFFATRDPTLGVNLYATDGTADGTRLAKFFRPVETDLNLPASVGLGTVFRDMVFFAALEAGAGTELWRSDGTVAGTILLKDIVPGTSPDSFDDPFPNPSNPRDLTAVGGNLFFTAELNAPDENDNLLSNRALWKSDGTPAGTVMVKDIRTATDSSNDDEASYFTDVNGILFFGAQDADHGFELWRSDGTEAGTFMVKDIRPEFDEGEVPGFTGQLTNVNGTAFFIGLAPDLVHYDLYKSDGTEAGTVPVAFNVDPDTPISFFPSTNIFLQSNVTGQVIFTETGAPGELTFGAWTDATGPEWHARAVGNLNAGPGLDEVIVQNDAEGIIYFASRDTGSLVWGVVGNGNVPGWTVIDAADIMGRESDSPIIQENATGTIFYADMTGGQFQSWKLVNTALTPEWKAIGAADVTGDGFADVVVQHDGGTIVYADMKDGVFQGWGSVVPSLDFIWRARAVGDVTGDGYADVIVQNVLSGVTYYADMEKQGFARWGVVAAAITPEFVVRDAVDIDHDGDTEVIFQNTTDGNAFYAIANGAGLHDPAWRLVAIGIDTEWVVV